MMREPKFGNLLICVEVNGKGGLMILDTGSSTTIVSERLAGPGARDLQKAPSELKGSGWVSSGRWDDVTIHLGNRYWANRRVIVDDLEPISKSLGWPIDGVFAEDLLRQYRSVLIDYRMNSVKLVAP